MPQSRAPGCAIWCVWAACAYRQPAEPAPASPLRTVGPSPLRSLSVVGPPRRRVPVDRGSAAPGCRSAPARSRGQGEAPAKTNDLDAGEDRRRLAAGGAELGSGHLDLLLGKSRQSGARVDAQPYLGARTAVRRQDDRWGDPRGALRPLGLSRPSRLASLATGTVREPVAEHLLDKGRGDARWSSLQAAAGTSSSPAGSTGRSAGASASPPSSRRMW